MLLPSSYSIAVQNCGNFAVVAQTAVFVNEWHCCKAWNRLHVVSEKKIWLFVDFSNVDRLVS